MFGKKKDVKKIISKPHMQTQDLVRMTNTPGHSSSPSIIMKPMGLNGDFFTHDIESPGSISAEAPLFDKRNSYLDFVHTGHTTPSDGSELQDDVPQRVSIVKSWRASRAGSSRKSPITQDSKLSTNENLLPVSSDTSIEGDDITNTATSVRYKRTRLSYLPIHNEGSEPSFQVDDASFERSRSTPSCYEMHTLEVSPASTSETDYDTSVSSKNRTAEKDRHGLKTFSSAYRHSMLADILAKLTLVDASFTKAGDVWKPFRDDLTYSMNHQKVQRKPKKWYGRWSTRSIILLSTAMILLGATITGIATGLYVRKQENAAAGLTPTWRPAMGSPWQIKLSGGSFQPSFHPALYDIDLFDNSNNVIDEFHKMGRAVICYFSAGTYENWRSDAGQFPARVIGSALPNWPDEQWLDIRAESVRDIMAARLQLAHQKGCDGVDPDNVDGYGNASATGFPFTIADSISYVQFLATQAHSLGLAIGLKNAPELINKTLGMVDWAITESCAQHKECELFQPFIQAGMPVFHIEYAENATVTTLQNACNAPGTFGFSTLIKRVDLDLWSAECPVGIPAFGMD